MVLPVAFAVWLFSAMPAQAEARLQPDPIALKDELQHLQGTWQIELQEENGDKVAADDLKGRTISFGKNAFFVKKNNAVVQVAMLKLDPSKTPKTVNAMVMQGEHKDDIMQGIYDLDGDKLKICFDTEGQQRPKEFKTTPKSGLMLIVCKRVRAKGEDQELTGVYKSETVEIDGTKHVSEATIERVGEAYLVTYRRDKGIAFVGIGLRKGDIFCMSWLSQGQVGVSMYQIEKGPRLIGQFTQLGGPGILGSETLTRVQKEV